MRICPELQENRKPRAQASPGKQPLLHAPSPPLHAVEKELARCKEQLRGVMGERDAARQELRAAKEAARQGGLALAEAREKAAALERELAFYQQQARAGQGPVGV